MLWTTCKPQISMVWCALNLNNSAVCEFEHAVIKVLTLMCSIASAAIVCLDRHVMTLPELFIYANFWYLRCYDCASLLPSQLYSGNWHPLLRSRDVYVVQQYDGWLFIGLEDVFNVDIKCRQQVISQELLCHSMYTLHSWWRFWVLMMEYSQVWIKGRRALLSTSQTSLIRDTCLAILCLQAFNLRISILSKLWLRVIVFSKLPTRLCSILTRKIDSHTFLFHFAHVSIGMT